MAAATETPRGMKPREFARAYNWSDSAVYNALRKNLIPHIRVGGRIIVLARQFEEMAQAQDHDDTPTAA